MRLRFRGPKFFSRLRFFSLIIGLASAFLCVPNADAIISRQVIDWSVTYSELAQVNKFPVKIAKKNLSLSRNKLYKRHHRSKKDQRIEPITLFINQDGSNIESLATKLAKRGRTRKLARLMQKKKATAMPLQKSKGRLSMVVDDTLLNSIDVSKLLGRFKAVHHEVSIDGKRMLNTPGQRDALLQEVRPFLNDKALTLTREKLSRGEQVPIDRYLLTSFARKMVGKYILFRGPNCFHASLAFHNLNLARSPYLNVVREKHHHEAMVNYDELWRTLGKYFFEVSPKKTVLKYGDILVFFDINGDPMASPYYKDIRHAAVYLFNNFAFSKGSKSPNSPYSVKTLIQEWQHWQKHTRKLGVRVYRKATNYRSGLKSPKEIDWLY